MAHTDVETLNTFLRTECSAVETYRRALDHVQNDRLRSALEDCRHDHERRVESLRERIERLGGTPQEGSGLWDTFEKLTQAGPDALGEREAIEALEEGEDHELADLQRDLKQVHGEARRFVRMELLPAQKRTHERISRLKRTLH